MNKSSSKIATRRNNINKLIYFKRIKSHTSATKMTVVKISLS